MAAQTSFKLQEEELSCPICFEEFNLNEKSRQPKLLLCLHTFCLACMETLRKYDGTLQCSICRTSHHVYRVCDLMDNYLIFEHLRIKQEFDDEKLAEQLKEEYEESVRALKEQEERDAQLAKEEDEKNRQEIERLRKEEEKRKEEYEKQELERLERLRREEEEERLRREIQVQERLRVEAEQERLEQERKREEEEEQERSQQRNTEATSQILSDVDILEDRESSSDSTETRSDHSDDSAEESDTEDDDESFQEVECERSDDDSPTSVVDDYETLSSDTDHYSTEVISSDEHEDPQKKETSTNTKNSQREKRSRSASPVPDLLSEEFSGVAPVTSTPKAPKENLSKLLPTVNCRETPNGTIVILDSSTDEQVASDVKANPSQDLQSKAGYSGPFHSSGNSDTEHESKDLSAPEEECHSFRKRINGAIPTDESRTTSSSGVKSAVTSLHLDNDENCKLQ